MFQQSRLIKRILPTRVFPRFNGQFIVARGTTTSTKTTDATSSSKELTIADVLASREKELKATNGRGAANFEEWESIAASRSVHDAISLMVKSNMGSLIVTEEQQGIVGIVTERDIMKKTSPRDIFEKEYSVKDIMSSHIMCIHPTTTVMDALATMTKENFRHLAVIHGEMTSAVKKGSVPPEAMRCVLSINDIIKSYSRFEAEKKENAQALAAATAAPSSTTSTTTETSSSSPSSDASPVATPQKEGAQNAATTTTDTQATTEASTPAPPPMDPATPAPVTAATLLKKKTKKIQLILNTRIDDNISVAEAVEEMAKHNFGSVLVVDKEQRLHGIFTERDYLTNVLFKKEDPSSVRLTDIATKEVACLQVEDTLETCWNYAATKQFRHFPVVGHLRKDRTEKELAGILSIKDIVREISKGHDSTPGFWLMELFKSKMEPAPPAPATPPAEPKATEDASTSTDTTSQEQKIEVAESEKVEKKKE